MMSHKSYEPGPQDPEYWYNLKTGEIEEGQQSRITSLWGPFPTREEAENAMETAKHRNTDWEEHKNFWPHEEATTPQTPEA